MNTTPNPRYKADKRRGRPERRKTPLKHLTVDREWFAWAAGIVDGEGYFGFNRHVGVRQTKIRPIFTLSQTDRRMLDRFQAVVEMGKIYGPFGPYANSLPNTQPYYRFDVYGFEQTQALIAALWTWLGPVKRLQAKLVLQEYLSQGE